jgi:hypothetical protein
MLLLGKGAGQRIRIRMPLLRFRRTASVARRQYYSSEIGVLVDIAAVDIAHPVSSRVA